MPLVLFDTDVKQYIRWEGAKITWTSSQSEAKQFRDKTHIQHFQKCTLEPYCVRKNIRLSRFQIVKTGENPQIPASVKKNTPNNISLSIPEPAAGHADEEAQNNMDILPSKIAGSEPRHLDFSELGDILSDIPSAISSLLTLYGQVDTAIERCNHIIRDTDLETSDLLHKCEFSNPNAADGYKFFKEIQICRIRRRNAKDMLKLLEIIRDSGVVDSIYKFVNQYGAYQYNLENRTYRPRIRNDLFSDCPAHIDKRIGA